jgi:hypothetical protein
MVADTPPYSTLCSFTAPDMQMVVVPPTSTNATTAIAKVSFMALLMATQLLEKSGADVGSTADFSDQKDLESGFRKIRVN